MPYIFFFFFFFFFFFYESEAWQPHGTAES